MTIGPPDGPLTRCPFGHCSADVRLIIEQKSAADDETTQKRVPQHVIVGEASRFGGCPASLMVIPLDAYSREALKTQAESIGRMLRAEQGPTGRGDGRPVRPPRTRYDPRAELNRQGYADAPKRPTAGPVVNRAGFAGQTVVPLPDVPHAGPGPGRASKPFQPTAADVVEVVPRPKLGIVKPDDQPTQQGSTGDMTDNDIRSQLRALCSLAIEGFGQQQEQCSNITEMLDQLDRVLKALQEKQAATHTLAVAAVGSQSSIPESAAAMVGGSNDVAGALEQLAGTIDLARVQVGAAHQRAGTAVENGRLYLAVI